MDELKALIEASTAETRRHFDIVAEALKTTIQVVAEGVSANSEQSLAWTRRTINSLSI